jgi:hypothetical protein
VKIREFNTGATRDTSEGKFDFEGFLSPLVIRRYAEYMHSHRLQPNGFYRDSDNWQRGIPKKEFVKSLWRHFMDLWSFHRGYSITENIEDALCGIIFNASGYLHEYLKEKNNEDIKNEEI